MRTFSRTLARTAVLQIDSVNVLQRAHYMPLFSRMGPYDVDLLRRAAEQPPAPDGRVLGARGRVHAGRAVAGDAAPDAAATASAATSGSAIRHDDDAGLVAARRGPRARVRPRPATSTTACRGHGRTGAGTGRSPRRRSSTCSPAGQLAVSGRNSQFERLYDLPERVIPAAVLDAPVPTDERCARRAGPPGRRRARRRHRAAACATTSGCGPSRAGRPCETLVESGELLPVRIEGWTAPGLPAPRRRAPARGARARPAQPVRPGRVGAHPHRAAVRLPLPDRDLRAGAAA